LRALFSEASLYSEQAFPSTLPLSRVCLLVLAPGVSLPGNNHAMAPHILSRELSPILANRSPLVITMIAQWNTRELRLTGGCKAIRQAALDAIDPQKKYTATFDRRARHHLRAVCQGPPATVITSCILAREGFYDEPFPPLINNFMIQGGDPEAADAADPGISLRTS